MRVIATAGHVDHGKSTLVRALTGMEPDRWAEERRRGMTIDLGFAWTMLDSGERLAFVDVPGHERFVTNMLAGVGPSPAVMFVVAADEGWRPQSAEHLVALHALGVRHGLLAVTRADLADPELAIEEARLHLEGTSLAGIPAVAVSGLTGQGIPELRAALDRLAAELPEPDRESPVRLWIDRVFTVTGAGTVVTGTLTHGTLRVGDELAAGAERVQVRGLQTLNQRTDLVPAVARVAVNLRGTGRAALARGMALLTPGAWITTEVVDVRLDSGEAPKGDLVFHLGSAAAPARLRPLGEDTARLTLSQPLALRSGDRGLLRDPGRRAIVTGVRVLDVRPAPLRRRGAAAARAAALAGVRVPTAADLLRWHGLLSRADLTAMGCPPPEHSGSGTLAAGRPVTGGRPAGRPESGDPTAGRPESGDPTAGRPDSGDLTAGRPVTGDWFADPDHWSALGRDLVEQVSRHAQGITVEAAAHLLGLPGRRLVEALVAPPLTIRSGVVRRDDRMALPPRIAKAVAALKAELAERPFDAPTAERLAELDLTGKSLAAAIRAGELLAVARNVVLLPDAPELAATLLGGLPSPFTVSQARAALNTSRRVAVPLLEHLDARGITRRVDNESRICAPPG
ncbi:selenocysteine-specific translation elongation factor [Streptosporangium sp. NPDC000396]|uniref:selenocysteine-specific translation elongation factor n=1 Tax=Streptosporangium sp. NPDC000396 TaxID=3366185 RepID=UPI0036763B37